MAPPSAATTAPPLQTPTRVAWIDGAGRDLLLYIGTPLLLLPFILAVPGRPALQDFLLYAGAFGALGHHLPGMMRAYGDRGLFSRFRVRFILAPLFLVPVCVYFSIRELDGIVLMTLFWTNWHSLMQVYGFARIYDAKVGSTSRWTSRLDHTLCLVWFGAPLLLSDSRLGSILELWYRAGGPFLSPELVGGLRSGWLGACAAVTLAWAAHTGWEWSRGHAPNLAKLALLASSFGFWWVCMAMVDHLLLGIALFDIFHDVQYLALVWTFNRTRVDADPEVGRFSQFLFRGRMTLVGVYVGMVVAYGSLGYFSELVSQDLVRQTLLGILAASALLHFYFDGFIWKVRESSTRKALSMRGGGPDIKLGRRVPGWAVHGSKWLLFVVPLGAMFWWETHDTRPEKLKSEAVVASVPGSGEALTHFASLLDIQTEPDRVLAVNRRAIQMKPSYPVAHNNFGVALLELGRLDEAKAEFAEAIRLQPTYGVAHLHMGTVLLRSGDPAGAEEYYLKAAALDPKDARAHARVGFMSHRKGRVVQAIEHFERALQLSPDEPTALNGLAWLLSTAEEASVRDGARAVDLAERLLALSQREDPVALDTAAAAYAEAGRQGVAVSTAEEAIAAARAAGRAEVVEKLEARLQSYRSGNPWRGDR